MKKLIFAVMAMFAMSFAACGNQTGKNAAATDSDSVVVDSIDSVAADTIVTDSIVAE